MTRQSALFCYDLKTMRNIRRSVTFILGDPRPATALATCGGVMCKYYLTPASQSRLDRLWGPDIIVQQSR